MNTYTDEHSSGVATTEAAKFHRRSIHATDPFHNTDGQYSMCVSKRMANGYIG